MGKDRLSIKNIILEILIVIIGITIAFWVNNWGEEKKERKLEMEFLRSLDQELASDSSAFHYQITNNQNNLKYLNQFIRLCREKDYRNDSAQWLVGHFLNRNNWVINSNTYDMLKSGGKLDIISDFELRSEISAFFHIRVLQTSKLLDIIQEFMDRQMDPYLTENSDYHISLKPDLAFIEDRTFQNLLVQWRDLTEVKLNTYEEVIEDIGILRSRFRALLE